MKKKLALKNAAVISAQSLALTSLVTMSGCTTHHPRQGGSHDVASLHVVGVPATRTTGDHNPHHCSKHRPYCGYNTNCPQTSAMP